MEGLLPAGKARPVPGLLFHVMGSRPAALPPSRVASLPPASRASLHLVPFVVVDNKKANSCECWNILGLSVKLEGLPPHLVSGGTRTQPAALHHRSTQISVQLSPFR